MSKSKKLTLVVSHNIFLTRDQRYKLVNGETIEVIGSNVPVWICRDETQKKGYTSEPAVEVFCRYVITNNKVAKPIHAIEGGYQINLPQLPSSYKERKKIPNDKWRKMSAAEKNAWYDNNKKPATSENLRDISDKGCEYLRFEEYNMAKIDEDFVHMGHHIKIDDMQSLNKSLEKLV